MFAERLGEPGNHNGIYVLILPFHLVDGGIRTAPGEAGFSSAALDGFPNPGRALSASSHERPPEICRRATRFSSPNRGISPGAVQEPNAKCSDWPKGMLAAWRGPSGPSSGRVPLSVVTMQWLATPKKHAQSDKRSFHSHPSGALPRRARSPTACSKASVPNAPRKGVPFVSRAFTCSRSGQAPAARRRTHLKGVARRLSASCAREGAAIFAVIPKVSFETIPIVAGMQAWVLMEDARLRLYWIPSNERSN